MTDLIYCSQGAVNTKATKRSFQNRFPKLANGVSTKYDSMTRFLQSDSYATALGVSGTAMHDLRLLIEAGVNRLSASPYIEMAPGNEAYSFTYLLTQIPNALPFYLSAAERDGILLPTLTDAEQYKG